jgi:hypothetical protein
MAGTMIRAIPVGLLAIVAAAVIAPQVNASATTVVSKPKAPTTTVLCKHDQHIIAKSSAGVRVIVRNDNYGRQAECLRNHNDGSNFTVTKSAATGQYEPVAYPNVFIGCLWGLCTPKSGLPRRVDRVRSLVTSWSTVQRPAGHWSAGYDIWFNHTRTTTGQNNGAELMIWLNSRGIAASHWPLVTVDHVRWRLAHWVAGGRSGQSWNYIQFRRVRPATAVRHLNVRPFIWAAEHAGLINQHWWLTSVEAGFEIWKGGIGLGTKSFWARL